MADCKYDKKTPSVCKQITKCDIIRQSMRGLQDMKIFESNSKSSSRAGVVKQGNDIRTIHTNVSV